MCNYVLLAPHVTSDGRLLEEGTKVGDDADVKWSNPDGSDMRPSTQMMGTDEDGTAAVNQVWQDLYGHDAPWESEPYKTSIANQKAAKEAQVEAEKNSEPVSPRQALERKLQEMADTDIEPLEEPLTTADASREIRERELSSTANAIRPKGGVTTPAPGAAAPRTPQSSSARATEPNKEQYPKDG